LSCLSSEGKEPGNVVRGDMGRVTALGQPLRSKDGVSVMARPLAREKLLKRALKVVRKASKVKKVRRGVKEVQKALRKNQKGVCVLAGDISPIDVISHLPVLCEDHSVPYVFVPSKSDLGAAAATKRPTSCIMIVPEENWEHKKIYDDLVSRIEKANLKSNDADTSSTSS